PEDRLVGSEVLRPGADGDSEVPSDHLREQREVISLVIVEKPAYEDVCQASLRLADEGSATLRSRDGAVSLQLRKRPLHRALTQGGHAHEFQFGWKTVTSAPETPRDPFSDGCPETHVLRDSVRLATEELQKLLPDLVVL